MKTILTSSTRKLKILFLLFCMLSFNSVFSQSYNLYTQRHFFGGDTAVTTAYKVTYDNNGNAYFTGLYRTENVPSLTTSYGIAIWKVNTSGVTVATTPYQYSLSGNGDKVVDMKFISGNLYLLVDGKFDVGTLDRDAVLIKFNSSLALQWEKTYDGAGSPDDLPIALEAGASNSLLFLVKSLGNIVTVRYNTQGNYLSSGLFNSGLDDTPVSLKYFNNATYVTGTKDDGSGGRTTVLIKYNNNLVQQWQKSFAVSGAEKIDIVNDLCIDTVSNFIYIAGGYHSSTGVNPSVIKYNSAGTKLWTRKIGFPGNSAVRVFVDNTGNPIIYAGGDANRYYHLNPADGTVTLTKNLFTTSGTHFDVMDVQKGSDNNIYALGDYDSTYIFNGNSTTDYGLAIAKIKIDGNRAWQTTIVNSVFRPDLIIHPAAFAVRGTSKVYYIYNRDDISLVPEEYFCGYGMRSATNGLRIADEEEKFSSINIYPNPAREMINIKTGEEINGESTVSIFDINGKLIQQSNEIINEGFLQLNIENYSQGIYLLRIENGENVYSSKFVKAEN